MSLYTGHIEIWDELIKMYSPVFSSGYDSYETRKIKRSVSLKNFRESLIDTFDRTDEDILQARGRRIERERIKNRFEILDL